MSEPALSISLSQARVLVVDDHPGTATTLARAISQLGPKIEVVSATSGEMALEQAREGAVDLLITDMMMPDMNGLQLIEKMQLHPGGRPTYTILITAYDVPGLKESARRLRVNETIIKPFRPEYIRQIVSKMLEDLGPSKLLGPTPETRRSSKILIADDVTDNLALLSRYLVNEGYSIITASNGIRALELTRSEMPDLILLDVNMPDKDGFEVLKDIRLDPAIEHIPVIILTAARLDPVDVRAGLDLGADDYVTKPFDRRELLARIRAKLRAKETEETIRRRYKELSVLPEIGKDLSGRLDLNELTEIVLRHSVETLGAMVGHMVIINQGRSLHKQYRLVTAAPPVFEVQLPPVNDLLNQLKDSHQGLIINDTRNDSHWKTAAEIPIGSVIIVPMYGRLDVIGLIILFHERPGYFNAEHQLLLQAIASQAAIALQNVQLYTSMSQERERMAAILESAADAILTFDVDACLVSLNPAGEKLFSNGSVKLGQPLAPDSGYDRLIELLGGARTSGHQITGEIALADERVFTTLVTPIPGDGFVAILHDVTYFKDLERVKNEFISTVSHDLKNPISVIAGFTELLERVGPLNQKQIEYIHRIQASAENMDGLVRCLLQLTRQQIGTILKKEVVAVSALVSEITNEFQPQANAREQALHFETPTEEPRVDADPFQLKQALRNLVGNAIKYTPKGGSICLSLEMKPEEVLINVKDTGCGIPPNELPLIFNRFHRVGNEALNGEEGDGLGLAIAKSIIEQHNGRISVESELGKGSCFTIMLPLG
jgi:two-component system, OmpR family, phosphate regulon sensor histidine kinase PhoR